MGDKVTNRLRTLRQKHKLSQQQLANMVGMKQSMITRIENDQASLTVENAIRIAELLGEPLEELWEETHKKKVAASFDFLKMLSNWQLEDLKDAIEKELERRKEAEDQ